MRHYWSAQAYMRAWLRDQLDHRRVQRVRRIGGAVLTTAQSLAVASQFGVSLAVGVGLGLIAGQWAGRSGPYGPPVHAARSLRRTHPWHDQRRCVVSSNPAFQRARVARGIARKRQIGKTPTGVADLEEAHDRIS